MSKPTQIQIFDTTLRDGIQSAGISVTVEDKLKIAKLLDEFGIHYIEGDWPGYTYQDRLYGAIDIMARAIDTDPDTRRAYWSLWRIEDSLRAHAPTRVPCSLSYQAFLRTINNVTQLEFLYTMRSSDYENFLPTDIFLANQFQLARAQ